MNVCQLIFKLKFLENLRRPLTLKSTRKRIEEKNKMQRRGKKAKRQFLPRKTKQALRKKTKQVSMPKKFIQMTNWSLLRTIWFQKTLATTRKRENHVNTAQTMARKSSTKQDEEATTEEVPGSIVISTEEEINTFSRVVKLSVLSLGHFISFSFATVRFFLILVSLFYVEVSVTRPVFHIWYCTRGFLFRLKIVLPPS